VSRREAFSAPRRRWLAGYSSTRTNPRGSRAIADGDTMTSALQEVDRRSVSDVDRTSWVSYPAMPDSRLTAARRCFAFVPLIGPLTERRIHLRSHPQHRHCAARAR